MINEHFLTICLHDVNKPIECEMRYCNLSHAVEITWNDNKIMILNPKRSMGKTKAGKNDPLVRYLYGTRNGTLPSSRYLLTVNCGFRIPFINLLDVTNHIEHFSFKINHEQQIKIDEFIDNLPISALYPTKDFLLEKTEVQITS